MKSFLYAGPKRKETKRWGPSVLFDPSPILAPSKNALLEKENRKMIAFLLFLVPRKLEMTDQIINDSSVLWATRCVYWKV